MDDLPELPFEKMLSYLSLEDRLKSRAVSRRWYHQINKFNVKTLCFSKHPAGFIEGKHRLVSGALAQNFISSRRFGCFFNPLRPTILSNLKHLRICDLRLNKKMRKSFAPTLRSFDQLEELDIIRFDYHSYTAEQFELTLPMLTSIWLEDVSGLRKLTLEAPRLQKIKLTCSSVRLDLVHGESVELLINDQWERIAIEKLKNLMVLYACVIPIDSAFLSRFEQLKKIHLEFFEGGQLEKLFEQKQLHDRTDLKIYLCGLLLNGPDDPAIRSLRGSHNEVFRCLAENPSRLADQIPFWPILDYSVIEHVAPGTEMSVLKRFIHLNRIYIIKPVKDIERFLNVLKNLPNIERLEFQRNQPQDLFDRLPEHCSAVQKLVILCELFDYRFLFRLQYLMELVLFFSIDAEAIRKVLEKNEFLSEFRFYFLNEWVLIEIEHPKRFKVSVGYADWTYVPDPNAVVQLITGESPPNKRKGRVPH